MTVFIRFVREFPHISETHSVTVANHPSLPPGTYHLNELYCADPECDCRIIRFEVSRPAGGALGTITWCFGEKPLSRENPYIEPSGGRFPQAKEALWLVQTALEEPQYQARLKRHYAMIKEAVAKPNHYAAEKVRQDRVMMDQLVENMVEDFSPPRAGGSPRRRRGKDAVKSERKRRRAARAKQRRRKKK